MGIDGFNSYLDQITRPRRPEESYVSPVTSYMEAKSVNPDIEARKVKLGRETDTPALLMDDKSMQNAQDQVDLKKFQMVPSHVQAFIANPENARVAHDDLDAASKIDGLFRSREKSTIGIATPQDQRFARNVQSAVSPYAKIFKQELLAAPAEIHKGLNELVYGMDALLGRNFIEGLWKNATGVTGSQERRLQNMGEWRQIAEANRPAKPETKMQSLFQGAAGSVVQSVAAAPLGIGGRVPMLAGFAATAGGNLEEYLKAGYSPVQSAFFSLSNKAMEGITELIGFGALTKIGSKPLRAIAEFTAGDLLGEEINTTYSYLMDKGLLNPKLSIDDYKQQVVDTAITTVMAGGIQGAITRPFAMMSQEYQRNQQAALNKDFMLALGEAAGESKLRQRLPEKFQELVARIREGGPVDNVYTPASQWTKYWQEKGLDPYEQADSLIENGSKQLAEAQASGGDLVIPIEVFATNFAATEHYEPLVDHIRLHPGDYTAFESAQMADDQGRILEELKASVGETVRPSHLKVYDDIMGQLQGIGYDRKTAEQMAVLTAARAKQRAAVLGRDAFELYQESPLRITRPLPEGVQRKTFDIGLDPLLDRLRSEDVPTESSIFGPSLLQFVRERGVSDDRGDLKSMDIDTGLKPGQRKIIREDGLSLDKLRESAVEAGYLNEVATTADLLNAIDKELRGTPVYSNVPVDQQAFDTKLALDELRTHFDQVGIEYNKLSNDQIRQQVFQEQGGELFQSPVTAYSQTTTDIADSYLSVRDSRLRAAGFDVDTYTMPHPLSDKVLVSISQVSKDNKPVMLVSRSMAGRKIYLDNVLSLLGEDERSGVLRPLYQAESDIAKRYGLTISSDLVDDNTKRLFEEYYPQFSITENGRHEATHENQQATIIGKGTSQRLQGFRDFARQDELNFYKSAFPAGSGGLADLRSRSIGNTLFQSRQDQARGYFRFSPQMAEREIGLLQNADLSTYIHELSHSWLEELKLDAARFDAPEQLKQDWLTIQGWLKIDNDTITVEQHEQFARGGEAYLMEGKAPSPELQGVFSRFKAWLTTIYRSLKGLNVQLNDDVRAVFDRLLASEDEIAAARSGQKLVELFATPEEAGMTQAEFDAYKNEAVKAHTQEVETLERKLMTELQREQVAWWKEERAKMRDIVEQEAFDNPVFKAIRMLSTGKNFDGTEGLNIKLDREALVRTYGEPILKRLPRGFGYSYAKEGGLHPDAAASLFGFESGDDMIRKMIEAPNINKHIEAETDIRMKELHGDMMLDGTVVDEAHNAIHNELRGQVLSAELKALRKKQREGRKAVRAANIDDRIERAAAFEAVPSRESFRLAAAQIISEKKIGEISPNLYLQAERRAADATFKATAKKDYAAAAEAKQQQLLNYYLYREAVKAQDQLDSMFKVYDKLKKPDKSLAKNRDIDMVNAARAILARFSIDRGEDNALSYLEIIKNINPDAYQDLSAAIEAATTDAKPYKQMTMPEIEQVHSAVLNLWNLSRRSKQVEIDGRIVNREEVAVELAAGLEELGLSDPKGLKSAVTTKDRIVTALMSAEASITRMEAWIDALDKNNPSGIFRKYLFNPVIDGVNKYRVSFRDTMLKYKELAAAVEPFMDNSTIAANEIGYTFRDTSELLGALLHTGNRSNLEKLIIGRDWGFIAEDGGLDTSAWDSFIRRMWDEGRLKKEHYDFVQGVWDLMESLKPDTQKAHHDMYGYYFSEITSDAFTTPFGEYRGGYAPAIADREIVQDQQVRDERDALESTNNSYMFPTTGRGFTKGRVHYNKPLVLDLSLVPAHIDKALRFTHIEPRVKDVGRVVMTPTFRDVLGRYNSEAASQIVIPWLQRAAQQRAETPGTSRFADQVWRIIRRNTGMQLMVANVSNTLQQFTGLFLAGAKVEKKYLAGSALRYATAPLEMAEQTREKSEMMATRTMQSAYDAVQQAEGLLVNPTLYEKIKDASTKHGYILQQITQHTVDVITWDAAYNQAVAEKATEKDAVRRADSAVRMTQGSFNAEDLSRLETGTPFVKAMTQFFTYFNMQANLLGSQAVGAIRDKGVMGSMPRLLELYGEFALAAIVSALIAQAFKGSGGGEDDENLYWQLLLKPQLQTAAAMVPGIGLGVNYLINRTDKNRYNDKMSVSPAFNMLEATLNVPVYAYKAAFTDEDLNDRMVWRDSLNAIGMVTGLPVGPLGRPIGYLAGKAEGKFEPKSNADFVRGLVQGTP